jgi:hypothetical protein
LAFLERRPIRHSSPSNKATFRVSNHQELGSYNDWIPNNFSVASRPSMATHFIPRAAFPALQNLPRSYYLGHHAKGLQQMKRMLAQVDLIIECRDYRVPLTSRNPLFEESLAGKPRVIVYTKRDLGVEDPRGDIARTVRSNPWSKQARRC